MVAIRSIFLLLSPIVVVGVIIMIGLGLLVITLVIKACISEVYQSSQLFLLHVFFTFVVPYILLATF